MPWVKLLSLLAYILGAGDVWPTVPIADGGSALPARTTHPRPAVPHGALTVRAHIWAHEDLDPDALRALGTAPGATLWLSTRANALRESTLDTLAKTPRAFVQVRAPFNASLREQLKRAGHAGLHVELEALRAQGLDVVRGSRPLAVTVRATLDEATIELLNTARPQVVLWRPSLAPDLLALSLARQVPGSLWLYWPDPETAPVGCTAQLGVTVVMPLKKGSTVDPSCARQRQFVLPARTADEDLRTLALTIPSAEVSFEIAEDVAGAYTLKKLLVALDTGK